MQGTWKNDKANGQGVFIYENGDRYEGNFLNSDKSGHGRYTFHDGSLYDGNFHADERNGIGSMIFSNGDRLGMGRRTATVHEHTGAQCTTGKNFYFSKKNYFATIC